MNIQFSGTPPAFGAIKAVVFDVDGTLLTEDLYWKKHLHALQTYPSIAPTWKEWLDRGYG